MLSQRQFERHQMSRYSQEWRESDWNGVVHYLDLKNMWQKAVKNIGEYWFGIPSTPTFKIAWEFPEHIARLAGMPTYMLRLNLYECEGANGDAKNKWCVKMIDKLEKMAAKKES